MVLAKILKENIGGTDGSASHTFDRDRSEGSTNHVSGRSHDRYILKCEEGGAMWTSSLTNQSKQSSADLKCNQITKMAPEPAKKLGKFRRNPCKASAGRIEKTVEEIEKSTLIALSGHFRSNPTSVSKTKVKEPSTFRSALLKSLSNETSKVEDFFYESHGPKLSLSSSSNGAHADSEPAASRQLQCFEVEMLDDELYQTSKAKSEHENSLPTSEDLPRPSDAGLPILDDLSKMTWPIFTSLGKLSKKTKPNPNYKLKIPGTESSNIFTTNDKKVGDISHEFATLHEYLSRKPLHDQLFWKQFDEIFETGPSRRYTPTDLNILVTVYEKLNLELFDESERPTLAADTSERFVLADNLFCSVTMIEYENETMFEVTPCWSSPEQYRLSRSRYADFTRLQCLMVLSATCLLINADKRKFGALLAYGHLVEAAYYALEHLLREVDVGGGPIAPWRDRVAALLSYAYYKLYLQKEKWTTFKDSYLEVMKLARNAWSDAQLVGGRSTIETVWPKSWDDLLLAAEGYFNDRVSLTGRELWRSAAIATLCVDARIRNSGSAEEFSNKIEILDALQRFTPVVDPVLKAVLALKKFRFCYRTEWNRSCERLEDVYNKKSLDAFQQDVGCMLVQYRDLRVYDAPPWVMVRFRSQLLETVIGHVVLLVIRNNKDAFKVGVKVLEDLILDDFLAPDGNVDTDESAHLRLASQSMFYFLTGQMSGRPPDSPSAPYDGHFALAVYSKLYVRKCVAIDSVFSLAIQAFEGPIDAFLKKDNAEKELMSTLSLLMPMLYERFSYECALMEIGYSPKRLSSLSWLEIADERQLTKIYNKLRKLAQGKKTEITNDISTLLGTIKDIEKDDAVVQKEFGTIQAKKYCPSCHLTDTANKSVHDGTPSQTLEVSMIRIDGKPTLCQGIRGTLYIRNELSGQTFPSYREAAPKTKAFVKTSSKTETCLNQSRLEDEIISLEHTSNNFLTNCAPVRVLQPDEYFFLGENEEINLHGLSSIDPRFLESSRMEEDFESETVPDLETSALSCNTFIYDTLQNSLTWTSAIRSEDCVEHVNNEMDVHPSVKSPDASVTSCGKTTTVGEFSKLSMKLDECPVRSDEVEVFLSNALPRFPPGQNEWPLEKVRAALCNSLLRIRNSKDWTEWQWVFKKYTREQFEAAADEMLQKESDPPLKHLVDLFDFVTTVMETYLCKNDSKGREKV